MHLLWGGHRPSPSDLHPKAIRSYVYFLLRLRVELTSVLNSSLLVASSASRSDKRSDRGDSIEEIPNSAESSIAIVLSSDSPDLYKGGGGGTSPVAHCIHRSRLRRLALLERFGCGCGLGYDSSVMEGKTTLYGCTIKAEEYADWFFRVCACGGRGGGGVVSLLGLMATWNGHP